MILFNRWGILDGTYICLGIYLSVLFIVLRKEAPTKDFALQKQPFLDVYKKDLLQHFLKLTGKHMYRSL